MTVVPILRRPRRLCKSAGIIDLRIHDLRRSYAKEPQPG
jgi:hypothetical protein